MTDLYAVLPGDPPELVRSLARQREEIAKRVISAIGLGDRPDSDDGGPGDDGEQQSAVDRLIVHHDARNGENLRGSTAIEGAATTILRAAKDGQLVTITNPKQKDAPEQPPLTLALTPLADSAILSHEAVGIDQHRATVAAQRARARIASASSIILAAGSRTPGAPRPWMAHRPSVSWITSSAARLSSSVRLPSACSRPRSR